MPEKYSVSGGCFVFSYPGNWVGIRTKGKTRKEARTRYDKVLALLAPIWVENPNA